MCTTGHSRQPDPFHRWGGPGLFPSVDTHGDGRPGSSLITPSEFRLQQEVWVLGKVLSPHPIQTTEREGKDFAEENTNANPKGRINTAGGQGQLDTGQAAVSDPGEQVVEGISGGLETLREEG